MTVPVTSDKREDLDRWLDMANIGDVIRHSRFPSEHYALWPMALKLLEVARIERMLKDTDLAYIQGHKGGYVLMTEERFNEIVTGAAA